LYYVRRLDNAVDRALDTRAAETRRADSREWCVNERKKKLNSENDDDDEDDEDSDSGESHGGAGERKDNYCYDVVGGGPSTRILRNFVYIIYV